MLRIFIYLSLVSIILFSYVKVSVGKKTAEDNLIVEEIENKEIETDVYHRKGEENFQISDQCFANVKFNFHECQITYSINGALKQNSLALPIAFDEDYSLASIRFYVKDVDKDGYNDLIIVNKQGEVEVEAINYFNPETIQLESQEYEKLNLCGRSFKNTLGFVTLHKYKTDENELITILNKDKSIWMEFPAEDLANLSKTLFRQKDMYINLLKDFRPWAVVIKSYGSGKIIFRCIAQDKNYYHIIVNDSKNEVKRLKKSYNAMFQTVKEHLLEEIIVNNQQKNPIRQEHDENSPIVDISQEALNNGMGVIYINEVLGEWIRVTVLHNNGLGGWVRWKKDETFLISLEYSPYS